MEPEKTLEGVNPPFALRHGPDKHYVVYGITLGVSKTIDEQIKEWIKWDKLEPFIVKAINEKWGRGFGEPLRWIRLVKAGVNDRNTCPNCKVNRVKATNYCPSCGIRLLPPEEDNND